jgi:hypothetical protein
MLAGVIDTLVDDLADIAAVTQDGLQGPPRQKAMPPEICRC